MDRDRIALLQDLLAERILVLDGAMGTAIQACDLTADDFGGPDLEGCNEWLMKTRPDVIRQIHADYCQAGADIIETNTFGGTPLVLDEYGLGKHAREINRLAAELAREVAAEFTTSDKPRFVAGSMGPTTKAISVTGGVTFAALKDHYKEQALGLIEGGSDYLLVETIQDTRNAKAALLAISEACKQLGIEIPLAISGTIEQMGTTLAGQTIEAFLTSVRHVNPLYIGLNCATGPEQMTDHLRALSSLSPFPVGCVPNAGLPDENGCYNETPQMLAAALKRFIESGWLNLVGGCCGTGAAHVAELGRAVIGHKPRVLPNMHGRSFVSGLENLEITDENRPVLVGERTNLIGSKKFKKLIREGDFEAASEIARKQVKGGAHIIDICLADPDGDEPNDMEKFLDRVTRKVKVPLMLDSTDADVFARALTWCQGKAILNSINLEDGEERFAAVVPLGQTYGVSYVVGCIDEDPDQGMAVTRQRKLEVAERSFDLLVNSYGVAPEDIIFDPLVFPCATGDQNYLGSARETVEGVRLIKRTFPECKTILGISNVSFGLPLAAREIVNSVFLYHCTKAGLDLAIVNTERLERYASIPEEERRLAEKVLFESDDAAIARITEKYRGAKGHKQDTGAAALAAMTVDERLAYYIVEGTREGLIADLDAKLKDTAPLDVINGPLMAGMDEVGRLFNANELIVAEVLQSAEVMKAAVDHLEPFMEKTESSTRGKVILATVKGDVHDIGKNLVDIILSNNGYKVINLGIKVPPGDLIAAVKEHKPDLVGLSGLLVKSATQMVVTAEEMKLAGVCPPMLVGGAALSKTFTAKRIAPAYGDTVAYAQDAMSGLELAGQLMDPDKRAVFEAEWEAYKQELVEADAQKDGKKAAAKGEADGEEISAAATVAGGRPSGVAPVDEVPQPKDFERHILNVDLDEVWPYINPAMLYNRHLGLKGKYDKLLQAGDEKAVKLTAVVDELKELCRGGAMQAKAVWRVYEAESEGDSIRLYARGNEDRQDGPGQDNQRQDQPAGVFTFPRQRASDRLCLADYARNGAEAAAGGRDNIGLFLVTAGGGIRDLAEDFKVRGEFLKSHAIQALALETAEATAEWLHLKLREWWGIPDDPDLSMMDIFRAKYRGCRYSFGYPACPALEDQELLFELIKPGDIGVQLTDGYMMDPEASVSALVFHHPEAVYFSVGSREEGVGE